MMFSLEHLTPTQFEEFTFDLLKSLDFVNLSWRKGTGLAASPADQGRDIEGDLQHRDVDGRVEQQKWFIECKHYQKGVPPDKLSGALAWAQAHRPHTLLIVASSFLSNPSKAFLDEFEKNNRPPFRIRVWELKDLENLTADRRALRQRYNLPMDIPSLDLLNKYHLLYATKPHLNSIEYFVALMDDLDVDRRDEAFSLTYYEVVRPRLREQKHENEKIKDLMLDAADYSSFRARLLATSDSLSLRKVQGLVLSALMWSFHYADKTSVPDFVATNRALIEQLEADSNNEEFSDEERANYARMTDLPKKVIAELPARTEKAFQTYTYICENLVRKLLVERPRYLRDL